MHQKEYANKLLIQTVSAVRVLVFFVLLLVSMVSALHTAQAATISSKNVRGHVHAAHSFATTPDLYKALPEDAPLTPVPYSGTAQATAPATMPATAQATVQATAQATDGLNGPQGIENQVQPGQNNLDGTDDGDVSKIISVDDNTTVAVDGSSSVVVIDSGDNCDNDHQSHHHHSDNHNHRHHHHHDNNNSHSGGHVFAAGGAVVARGGGGYPAMPFTGGDPRPLADK